MLIISRGLLQTQKQAQAQILSGNILVNDVQVSKPGVLVPEDVSIRFRVEPKFHVSRGAEKIGPALREFSISPMGKIAMDIGASTGGFSQVLLREGAKKVYCIDVGVNLLAWEVRSDPRVIVMEGVNARYLKSEMFSDLPNLIVIDVSFISLTQILPASLSVAAPNAEWVTLIKPQFEVEKLKVGAGGLVHKEEYRQEAIDSVTRFAETIGLQRVGLIKSPIKGQKGNIEFLAHWIKK